MHTFSFYSISNAQADALREKFGKAIEGNMVKGKTPLGEVALQYNYSPASGQLTISVIEKPFVITNGMIETHLRDELNTIAAELAQEEAVDREHEERRVKGKKATESEAKATPGLPVVAPPSPATVPAPTPTKKEALQKVADASKG